MSLNNTAGPVDRFFDFAVGSDYQGTLIRDDSQAQPKVVVHDLGLGYIRFHAIFHDVLGTLSVRNGPTVYNWTVSTGCASRIEAVGTAKVTPIPRPLRVSPTPGQPPAKVNISAATDLPFQKPAYF